MKTSRLSWLAAAACAAVIAAPLFGQTAPEHDEAVASGFRDRGLAERDDDLASLRGTERFQRLLARIGAS